MIQKELFNKQNISIATIWLFHISGLIGIIYSNSSWFVKATPLNLALSFLLVLINTEISKKTVFLFTLCFTVGMIAEIIGVNKGLIFGEYSYGNALGIKVFGVPILIGINWCILVFITGFIADTFFHNFWQKILLGIFLMISLDLVMEPVAPVLDFWTFKSGLASFQNYLGWSLVSFPLHFSYQKLSPKISGPFPFHLFILQFLFFTILLIKINSFDT